MYRLFQITILDKCVSLSEDNEKKMGQSGSVLAKGPLDTRSHPSASVYSLLGIHS